MSKIMETNDEIIKEVGKQIKTLVRNFILEKNAKNKAYYFILHKGLYDDWVEFCKENKDENYHQKSIRLFDENH